MFERLQNLFAGKSGYETPMPDADAQHALGALMVRAAKADKAYLFEEVEMIDAVLSARHGLNPIEAAKMRAECEKLEESMPDTTDLAAVLQAINMAEREATVAALWAVVFADGVEQDEEDALLHEVEAILGVPRDVSKRLHDAEAAKRPVKRT